MYQLCTSRYHDLITREQCPAALRRTSELRPHAASSSFLDKTIFLRHSQNIGFLSVSCCSVRGAAETQSFRNLINVSHASLASKSVGQAWARVHGWIAFLSSPVPRPSFVSADVLCCQLRDHIHLQRHQGFVPTHSASSTRICDGTGACCRPAQSETQKLCGNTPAVPLRGYHKL